MMKASLKDGKAVRAKIIPNTNVQSPPHAFTRIQPLVILAHLAPPIKQTDKPNV
jgi:hypothetical protein